MKTLLTMSLVAGFLAVGLAPTTASAQGWRRCSVVKVCNWRHGHRHCRFERICRRHHH